MLALIFGIIALKKINKSIGALTGKGLAIAGIILGSIGIILGIIWILVVGAIAIPNLGRSDRTVFGFNRDADISSSLNGLFGHL